VRNLQEHGTPGRCGRAGEGPGAVVAVNTV
jgi:hypothetical protein